MSTLFDLNLGPGGGIPVILLHGLTIDHQMMLPLDPPLAAAGCTERHYLDLPGHGRSAPITPMSADAIVLKVAEHLDAVVDDRPFALIGASFGGQIVTRLSEAFGSQVLGSALLAPAVRRQGERMLPAQSLSHTDPELLAELDPAERSAFASVTAQQDRRRWAPFQTQVLPGMRNHDRDAIAELNASQAQVTPRILDHHQGQHLIITGKQDRIVGWSDQQQLLDVYPNSTYAVLDRCGHNVHLEHPDVVAGLLTSWLHALSG